MKQETKHTQAGFIQIHVEFLKKGQFFFFPNGRKRMVAESILVKPAWTEIIATSPTGRIYKRDIANCKLITIYQ